MTSMRLRAFHGPAWCAASTAVVVALLGCSSGPDSGAPTGGSSGSASGGVPNSGGVPGSAGTSGAPSTGMGGSLAGGSAGSSGATSGGGPVGGAGMGGSSGAAGSVGSGGVGDPGSEGDGDFTITYPFPAAPEMTKRDGVPAGMVITFTVKSGASAIYPTDVRSGNAFDRVIHVYVPNGYVPGTEAPFMVVQDGSGYIERFMPLLDNMIADGRLPKMIGVFINPGPGDGPGSQRGLEYDRVSDHYVRFIESEILPKIATDYNLKFTTNPEGRASFGCSSGAAAAFTMGWFRPDLYRRILTYSGTFVNQHSDSMYPHGAWGYHETLIPNSEPKPLRVFLSVGSAESTANQPASSFRNWVLANQGMAAALKAKDYHYRFVYAEGGGHCDGAPIAQTLPEAMLWLWRGYPR